MWLRVAYSSHHRDCPVTRQDDILAVLNFITKNLISCIVKYAYIATAN